MQERSVDVFDEDTSVLNGLDATGDLHQHLRGGFGIGDLGGAGPAWQDSHAFFLTDPAAFEKIPP
jgi:hypothetical protein